MKEWVVMEPMVVIPRLIGDQVSVIIPGIEVIMGLAMVAETTMWVGAGQVSHARDLVVAIGVDDNYSVGRMVNTYGSDSKVPIRLIGLIEKE